MQESNLIIRPNVKEESPKGGCERSHLGKAVPQLCDQVSCLCSLPLAQWLAWTGVSFYGIVLRPFYVVQKGF